MLRKIWVLSGGPSTEFEVSLSSARVVCESIGLAASVVRPVVISRRGRWIVAEKELVAGSDRSWLAGFFSRAGGADSAKGGCDLGEALVRMLGEEVNCAFLALHGQFGEDGCVQGFLETAAVPYTGSGVLASALSFNKVLTLDAYRGAGLVTAPGERLNGSNDAGHATAGLRFPVFVKPVRGGSSVGMSLVKSRDALEGAVRLALETDTEALVEEKVEGVEVSCGILDLLRNGRVVSTPLPPTEIRPVESAYFDYEAKYVPGKSREVTPAALPDATIRRIQDCALRAHAALGCEGMSRTDMIVPPGDGAEPVLIETNTIPGMTPTSLLPQQAAAMGIGFSAFLDALISHAMHRAEERTRRRV